MIGDIEGSMGIKASRAEITKWEDSGVDPELLNNDNLIKEQPPKIQTMLAQAAIANLDK